MRLPDTLSSQIIRIRCSPLRAALWTAWYPFALVDFLSVALMRGALLKARTWRLAGAIYIVGIDGI